jgi:hypothetical protein
MKYTPHEVEGLIIVCTTAAASILVALARLIRNACPPRLPQEAGPNEAEILVPQEGPSAESTPRILRA